MGLIHIELFATLDLVGQSPGGPDEDPVGFTFAGYWPHQEGEITTLFNRVPKYVASCGRPDPSWAGPVQVRLDLAGGAA